MGLYDHDAAISAQKHHYGSKHKSYSYMEERKVGRNGSAENYGITSHSPKYVSQPDWTNGNVPKPRSWDMCHEVKAAKRHNRHIITHMLQCIGLKQEDITEVIFENAAYLFAGRQPITRENLLLNS